MADDKETPLFIETTQLQGHLSLPWLIQKQRLQGRKYFSDQWKTFKSLRSSKMEK